MTVKSSIGSPCVGVCVIDARVDACYGCFRRPAEITAWPSATDDEKRAILAKLDDRREAAGMKRIWGEVLAGERS